MILSTGSSPLRYLSDRLKTTQSKYSTVISRQCIIYFLLQHTNTDCIPPEVESEVSKGCSGHAKLSKKSKEFLRQTQEKCNMFLDYN